jgi:hypothetical protein
MNIEWNAKNIAIAGAAIVTPILGFAWWLGTFKKVEIKESQFNGGTFIYFNWQGPLRSINKPFTKLNSDCADFKAADLTFTRLSVVGIYYDNPRVLKNPADFRCSVGVLLPRLGDPEALAALTDHLISKGYSLSELPATATVTGSFPHKAQVSFAIGAMKFYGKSFKYLVENKPEFIE